MSEFTLQGNRWYAWQMLPGYMGQRCVPYCSPIYLDRVKPLKTGEGILAVDFVNTGYAEGVQNFVQHLKILYRAKDYLVAKILYNGKDDPDRCAVISHIEFGWIKEFCPYLWHSHPPHTYGSPADSSVSFYLNAVFNIKVETE